MRLSLASSARRIFRAGISVSSDGWGCCRNNPDFGRGKVPRSPARRCSRCARGPFPPWRMRKKIKRDRITVELFFMFQDCRKSTKSLALAAMQLLRLGGLQNTGVPGQIFKILAFQLFTEVLLQILPENMGRTNRVPGAKALVEKTIV